MDAVAARRLCATRTHTARLRWRTGAGAPRDGHGTGLRLFGERKERPLHLAEPVADREPEPDHFVLREGRAVGDRPMERV